MTPPPARRHYEHAPITEAVIDIQIDPIPEKTINDVTKLADALKSAFPIRMPVYQLQMGFQSDFAAEVNAQFLHDKQNLGWRLNSKTTPRVLQLRTNGFTYSHLPPYSNWETFSAEAENFWSQYVTEMKPQAARRLAVRVINKLPVNRQDGLMSDVLDFYPRVPDALPRDVRSLALQLQLPMRHVDEAAALNLALFTAAISPDETSLILDIDLYVEKTVPVGKKIFETLNRIGLAKDDVFEACIKDTIRERIK